MVEVYIIFFIDGDEFVFNVLRFEFRYALFRFANNEVVEFFV